MQRLRRRDANALRARMSAPQSPGKPNLGDYGGAFDHEYTEGEVFRSAQPGQIVNAQGETVSSDDPYRNPVAFTSYPFTTNDTSPNGTGNGSVLILVQNQRRQVLLIQNLAATGINLFVNFGADAGLGSGLLLDGGDGVILDNGALGCPNNSVYVYFASATLQPGIIMEGAPVF